jgi:hypothetical protein
MKPRVRPSRWAFFARGPLVLGPLGNGLFSALTGALGGLWGAPAQPPQYMPDASGAIGDTKVLLDQLGYTLQGPEFGSIPVGASALTEEVNELLPLIGMEFGGTPTGMRLGGEASLRVLGSGSPPAPNGTGGSLDVSGHVTDAPAGFKQRDGHSASDFELHSCACRSHGVPIGRINQSL